MKKIWEWMTGTETRTLQDSQRSHGQPVSPKSVKRPSGVLQPGQEAKWGVPYQLMDSKQRYYADIAVHDLQTRLGRDLSRLEGPYFVTEDYMDTLDSGYLREQIAEKRLADSNYDAAIIRFYQKSFLGSAGGEMRGISGNDGRYQVYLA